MAGKVMSKAKGTVQSLSLSRSTYKSLDSRVILYSMGVSSGVGPLRISIACFTYKSNEFSPLEVHASR